MLLFIQGHQDTDQGFCYTSQKVRPQATSDSTGSMRASVCKLFFHYLVLYW